MSTRWRAGIVRRSLSEGSSQQPIPRSRFGLLDPSLTLRVTIPDAESDGAGRLVEFVLSGDAVDEPVADDAHLLCGGQE